MLTKAQMKYATERLAEIPRPRTTRREINAGADKVGRAPAPRRGDPLPAFVDPRLALL
jgi:hypothetical protein